MHESLLSHITGEVRDFVRDPWARRLALAALLLLGLLSAGCGSLDCADPASVARWTSRARVVGVIAADAAASKLEKKPEDLAALKAGLDGFLAVKARDPRLFIPAINAALETKLPGDANAERRKRLSNVAVALIGEVLAELPTPTGEAGCLFDIVAAAVEAARGAL